LLDLWYADDGYLVGNEADVVRAFAALQAPLASVGLTINPSKCQLWTQSACPSSSTLAVPASVAASSPTALSVLGLPVAGSEAAMRSFATSAVTKATAAAADIANLHHAQGESVLLRACGPTSRLRHLLRFSVSDSVAAVLTDADAVTLQHATRILGRPPPSGWETVAAQSVSDGGLGFELLTNLDCRTLSSTASDLVSLTLLGAADDDRAHGLDPGLLLRYREAAHSRPLPAVLAPPGPTASRGTPLDDAAWLRAASARAPFASAFLLATPGPDTTLDDAEFRDALWMRLGLPAAVGHTDCNPPARIDFSGEHRLGCKAAADARLRRHDALATVVAKTALSADPRAFQVSREAHVPDDPSQARPGDVALDLGDGRTYVDVTVVNAFTATHLTASRSAGSPALAAEHAFDRKTAKYADQFGVGPGGPSHKFVPLATTALGVWDERSLRWLRHFSDVCAAASSISQGIAFASLMTRLSIALWRGNSRMMRSCRAYDAAPLGEHLR
jgi:hypothetical protein